LISCDTCKTITLESEHNRCDTDEKEMLVSKRAPRYDIPKAAPDDLRLVQLFVNTEDDEHGRELLDSPRGLGDWLAEHGLLRQMARVTNDDLRRATELRGALRTLLRANNSGPEDDAAAAEVNRAARRARIELRTGPSGTAAIAVAAVGVDGALGGIVAAAFEAMLDGRWNRLKACRNCDFTFYDYSRNRTATWCSMVLCGNRLKTRGYRARQRERQAARRSGR
jgi:predicted RNA-binding Zn ribbon-like protein